MLAVVQDQQQPLVGHEAGQPLGHGRRRDARPGGLLAQPQGDGHHLAQQRRVAEGGQLGQPHPVRVADRQPPGQLHGQAGLARPTRPGHGDQPLLLDQLGRLAKLLGPPDQAGQPLGQVVAGLLAGGGRLQGRVLDQDGLLQPLQPRRRIDPQLLGQHRPGRLVHLQGVGLPPRPVQRQHQLAPQPLPGRMLGHQPLQLPDQPGVVAGGQPQLHQRLDRPQVQLLQPGRLGQGPGLVGELGQGRGPPQPERLRQRPGRRVPGRPAGLGDQPLEPGRVHLAGVGLQHVPGRAGDHQPGPGRPQGPAQGRHPALEGVGRVPRGVVAPQVLDQPVGRHHPAGVDQQVGQQGPLLGPRHPHQARSVADLQRPQDPELHPLLLPQRTDSATSAPEPIVASAPASDQGGHHAGAGGA